MRRGYELKGWVVTVGVDNTMRFYTSKQIAKGKRWLKAEFIGAKVVVNVYDVTPGLFDPKHGTRAYAYTKDATYADAKDIANRADGIMSMATWV